MNWLTYEEYLDWLKENANKEEQAAEEVVKKIMEWHDIKHYDNIDNYEWLFKPREVIKISYDEGRDKVIEFDLLIKLKHQKYDSFDKFIAVEFKETDSKKVVKQAIVRRFFVDYVYIALKNDVYIDPDDVLLLKYFGIGWVMWDVNPKFAYMIFPAIYKWQSKPIIDPQSLVYYMLRNLVEFHVKEIVANNLKRPVKYYVKNLMDFEEADANE